MESPNLVEIPTYFRGNFSFDRIPKLPPMKINGHIYVPYSSNLINPQEGERTLQ